MGFLGLLADVYDRVNNKVNARVHAGRVCCTALCNLI